MPVCADPADLIPYVLAGDRPPFIPGADPKAPIAAAVLATLPVFQLRALTGKELRQVNRLITQAEAETDDDKAEELLNQVIKIGVAGGQRIQCRGQSIDPTTTKPSDYLSFGEIWELVYAVQIETRLKERDRRNLSLPPASAPGSSAVPVPAASAAPTTESPSPSSAPPVTTGQATWVPTRQLVESVAGPAPSM